MDAQERRRIGVAAAGLAVLAVILGGVGLAGWHWMVARGIDVTALTPAEAARLIRGYGAWSPACAVLLMVLHSFVPLPAEVIALGNGMVFGPALGVAVTWGGAMLGAILSFALARWLGRPLVRALLPARQWRRLETMPRHAGMLLLARLVPVISFNLINYAAGLLGIAWWTFLWTTALGILPFTVAMVVLGYHMAEAPVWVWSAVGAAAVGAWLLWRLRRAR